MGLYHLPDEIDGRTAALMEPFTAGARAARRSQPKPGEGAVVFGAGTIGIAAAVALKESGYFPEDVADVLKVMASGKYDLSSIITHEFPQAELAQALELAGQPD